MTIVILDRAACGKAITGIQRFAGKLQARIHVVAVSTLDHIREHGDTTLACKLLGALPKGQRVKALAAWYAHFSNGMAKFSLDKSSGAWTCKLKTERLESDFDIDAASLTSYADLTEETQPGKTFTLEQLIKKLETWANEDGMIEDGKPKVEEAARDVAAQLVATIRKSRAKLTLVQDVEKEKVPNAA